jgi:hypothetical protein
MPTILRVNDADGHSIGTADSLEGVYRVVEGAAPGRYHVDEISSEPLPCGRTSRRWGVGVKHQDGTVTLDPRPES